MFKQAVSAALVVFIFISLIATPKGYAGIPVTEADSEIPYEFLGSIEVQSTPGLLLYRALGIATIGFLFRDKVKKVKTNLNQKLVRKARLYSPEAIVNVVYSPDPQDPRFLRENKVYAKGDMIRYKRAYAY
jgi:hypothetical protein